MKILGSSAVLLSSVALSCRTVCRANITTFHQPFGKQFTARFFFPSILALERCTSMFERKISFTSSVNFRKNPDISSV